MNDKPQIATVESIKDDIDAIENNDAAWTPEWMLHALASAWQDGNDSAGLAACNPFLADLRSRVWQA